MKIGKKIFLMMLGIIASTLLAVLIYGLSVYQYGTNEFGKTYKSYGDETNVIEATDPFTVLLMGVDTGTGSREDKWAGNSDTMLILTINPKTETTTMMSLERDILVEIAAQADELEASGDGTREEGTEDLDFEEGATQEATTWQAKLNAAYAQGQAELAIETIEGLMNLNIDRYVQINMQGLVDLVDAVGGITVTNPFDFAISIEDWEPEYTATIEPGKHKVNGDQALVFARMRYQDPEGDYGRQRRQRQVIATVVKKVLSMNSVSRYKKILSAISANMQTNIEISSDTIPNLLGYADALGKIENYQLTGQDANFNGGSYQIVTKTHLLEMQNILRKALGKEELTELQTNAILYEDIFGFSPDITYDAAGNIINSHSYGEDNGEVSTDETSEEAEQDTSTQPEGDQLQPEVDQPQENQGLPVEEQIPPALPED